MSVETALVAGLVGDSALNAIISGRVYGAGKLPQDATKPFLVYQRISTEREQTLPGTVEASNVRWQFTMVSSPAGDVDAFQAALVAAVLALPDASPLKFFDRTFEDESEEIEPDSHPVDVLLRRLDVTIGHSGAS